MFEAKIFKSNWNICLSILQNDKENPINACEYFKGDRDFNTDVRFILTEQVDIENKNTYLKVTRLKESEKF